MMIKARLSFLVFPVVLAAPAAAHDWRCERAENAADLCRVRAQVRLGCAEQFALFEQQRWQMNQFPSALPVAVYNVPITPAQLPPRAPQPLPLLSPSRP